MNTIHNNPQYGKHEFNLSKLESNKKDLTLELGVINTKTTNLRIYGGNKLSGSINTLPSKNASVGLMCASLLNHGRTVIKNIAKIEEVTRIIKVLNSIGAEAKWINDNKDVEITNTADITTVNLDKDTAQKTRSIVMFLGPLIHHHEDVEIPYAGGCELGTRTVGPHLSALKHFGVSIDTAGGMYRMPVGRRYQPSETLVLVERGDTVTENAIMAAAITPGKTVIHNASCNYMVEDLCLFLTQLGVRIEGIGSTKLTIYGLSKIDRDVEFSPSEDPVESMSLLTAGIVTQSEITIQRCPIDFLEIELAILKEMGQKFTFSDVYSASNGYTRLVDITLIPGQLHAIHDKIHPMPYPGLNIDNLPFFAVICASAEGGSIIHDWVYDNRAVYLTELNRLGAQIRLADTHVALIQGPTYWRRGEVICPPALRPAVIILIAMLAAPGISVLRDIDVIHRGYEDLTNRLKELGAKIDVFTESIEFI